MADRVKEIVKKSFEQVRKSRLPQSVKEMIYLHMDKPWVKDFKSIAISPAKPGLEKFLGELIGKDQNGARKWYYPSLKWWKSHAKNSHPPAGVGCDVDVHVEFLTGEEFYYMNIFENDDYEVIDTADFERECDWWHDNVTKS